MGRKARPALHGLEALGSRLKQIRQRADLSQMQLAKLIGFDPAHGYKYILRLEKGQVPNPTLRTIAACLEACRAQWPSVVDVLPDTGTAPTPTPSPMPTVGRKSEDAAPAPQPDVPANVACPAPASPRRRDPRPLREQLRVRRIEQRDLRTRRFWSGVKQVDEATAGLLRSSHTPSNLHHAYHAFARACCSTLDARETARPEVAALELGKLVPPAIAQGLDRRILTQIQSTCTRVFRSQSGAG
jgi:transcriptional regulator with XRE-family HTH domain